MGDIRLEGEAIYPKPHIFLPSVITASLHVILTRIGNDYLV